MKALAFGSFEGLCFFLATTTRASSRGGRYADCPELRDGASRDGQAPTSSRAMLHGRQYPCKTSTRRAPCKRGSSCIRDAASLRSSSPGTIRDTSSGDKPRRNVPAAQLLLPNASTIIQADGKARVARASMAAATTSSRGYVVAHCGCPAARWRRGEPQSRVRT